MWRPVGFSKLLFSSTCLRWNMVPPSLFAMLDSIGTTSPKSRAGLQALDNSLSAVKTTVFPRSTPDLSRYRPYEVELHFSGKRCRLRGSTQHSPEVYSQEFGILKSFWDVDSSAAQPG